MQSIGSLLPQAIKRANLEKGVEASQVCRIFEQVIKDIIQPELAQKIKPLYIKNKTLVVASLSAVIAQELGFVQDKIIAQINQRLGKQAVTNIKFLL